MNPERLITSGDSLLPTLEKGKGPDMSSTKQFEEARVAVWLVLLLFEAAFTQGLQAKVTHKVVGVELGPHGCDAAAQDGLLAGVAHAPTGLVVVGLAQGFAFVLEEAAVGEGGVALLRRGERTNGVGLRQRSVENPYAFAVCVGVKGGGDSPCIRSTEGATGR